jgi:hypothetical protein
VDGRAACRYGGYVGRGGRRGKADILRRGARIVRAERRPAWAVRLQAEREKREWTKREMARRLLQAAGYTHGSLDSLIRQIRDWEKGRHFPRDWIRAYATAFDIDGAPTSTSGRRRSPSTATAIWRCRRSG